MKLKRFSALNMTCKSCIKVLLVLLIVLVGFITQGSTSICQHLDDVTKAGVVTGCCDFEYCSQHIDECSGWQWGNYHYYNCSRYQCPPGMKPIIVCSTFYWYYHCSCIDIDECASSPCANRATCENKINMFKCHCPKGYYGVLCDTNVCHPTPADVVFLLDSSVSMTEKHFNKQLEFVANFTDQVFIGPRDFQISVITFSFEAHIEFYLNNFTTNETVKEALKSITFKPGVTFTHKALEKVADMFDDKNGGGRIINGTIPDRFVFLLTDGMSTDKKETKRKANELKYKMHGRFQIYTLGIGNEVSHEELLDIASDPSFVYSAKDFDSLYTVLKTLVQITCEGCKESSLTDVALLVETSHGMDLGQFGITRDALVHLVNLVDLSVDGTRLSLASFDTTIKRIYDFSDNLNKHNMFLQINNLQLSDSSGPTLDMEDVLTYISANAFSNARPDSKLLAIIFSSGLNQIRDRAKVVNVKQDLLNKNVIVIFVGVGDNVDLDNVYGFVDDAYDVYLADQGSKRNLDALLSYMTYSVCTIEDG